MVSVKEMRAGAVRRCVWEGGVGRRCVERRETRRERRAKDLRSVV